MHYLEVVYEDGGTFVGDVKTLNSAKRKLLNVTSIVFNLGGGVTDASLKSFIKQLSRSSTLNYALITNSKHFFEPSIKWTVKVNGKSNYTYAYVETGKEQNEL